MPYPTLNREIADRKKSNEAGFTLINISMVLAIIMILAFVSFDALEEYLSRAFEAKSLARGLAIAKEIESSQEAIAGLATGITRNLGTGGYQDNISFEPSGIPGTPMAVISAPDPSASISSEEAAFIANIPSLKDLVENPDGLTIDIGIYTLGPGNKRVESLYVAHCRSKHLLGMKIFIEGDGVSPLLNSSGRIFWRSKMCPQDMAFMDCVNFLQSFSVIYRPDC